jgi:aminotransferase
MPQLSYREQSIKHNLTAEMQRITAEDKNIISLAVGEPDFTTPEPILNYAKQMLAKSTHYSSAEGLPALRQAIAQKLRKENKINANPNEIIVTSGSQEAIFLSLLATLDPGCEVLLPSPGYMLYAQPIKLVSAIPKYFPLIKCCNFEIDPKDIEKRITKKTRAIILTTPSNPTGSVISRKTLREIANIAIKNNLMVFSDEAYEKLVYGKEHISIASLPGMKNRTMTFQTFSKAYAMAGFRLGYVHAPKNFVKALTDSNEYVSICAPVISQYMGLKALSMSNKYVQQMCNKYNQRRKFIVKRLNEIGLQTCEPFGAFYTFSDISKFSKNSLQFTNHLLKKAKVAVMPGSEFGPFGEGHIRCTYSVSMSKIQTAMNRIEKCLK